jgi:hypothetical protein
MNELSAALRALAERGSWVHQVSHGAEACLAALRAGAADRGMVVHTGISRGGMLWACTDDGLPAEEPWRGAAARAEAAGGNEEIVLSELERLLGPDTP